MNLSEKYKYIFIGNPKTGTTAIERFLHKYDDSVIHNRIPSGNPENPIITGIGGHIKAADLERRMGKDYHNYKVFTFIRDPYDKAVSAYFFYKGGRDKSKKRPIGSLSFGVNLFMAKLLPFSIWSLIKKVKTNSSYILDSDGRVIVNYIGKTENLNNDLISICRKLGLDLDTNQNVEKANQSVRKPTFMDYYKNKLHKNLFDKLNKFEIDLYKSISDQESTFDWKDKRFKIH